MNLRLDCPVCKGDIKPLRNKPYRLREYSLRLYQCVKCKKKMVVASYILIKDKARWIERIYEEHTDEGL